MRPKESLIANTRLFFVVYQETEVEKSKTAYNLKVVHFASFKHNNYSYPDESMKVLLKNKAAAVEYTNTKFSHLSCLCYEPSKLM